MQSVQAIIDNKPLMVNVMSEILRIGGRDKQINILMEELGELSQAINKYYNRKTGYVEDLALEVADVELCIFQIIQMLDTTKCENIMNACNTIDSVKPSLFMSYCGKLMFMTYEHFCNEGNDTDELIFDICNVLNACKNIREDITDSLVDVKKTMKLVHLINIVKEANDDGK